MKSYAKKYPLNNKGAFYINKMIKKMKRKYSNYSLNQCLANSYEPLSYRDFGYVNVGNFLTQQKSVKKISDHPDSSRLHSYSQLFSFLQFALRIHFFLI